MQQNYPKYLILVFDIILLLFVYFIIFLNELIRKKKISVAILTRRKSENNQRT